jgi:adenylosuccinate synthase
LNSTFVPVHIANCRILPRIVVVSGLKYGLISFDDSDENTLFLGAKRLSNLSVIGLQWGDEAKGKLVDLLTAQCDIVVRYQGGANAGHTVVHGDQVYKLHHLPSGILHEGVMNVVTPGVVINPQTILQEIEGIQKQGVDVRGRLMLADRAHLVFPWHVAEDRAFEQYLSGGESIGTTLRGIGPCYRDKVGRSFAIRLGDLYRSSLREQVTKIAQFKQRALSAFGQQGHATEFDVEQILAEMQGFAKRLEPFVADTNHYLLDAVSAGKRLLFEGAQGALLDIDHGTFPFVTSSNSSGVGVSAGSGIPSKWIHQVIGVAKCYSTRVGGGPFPTELNNELGQHIREEGNEYGTTTGRPRRCGWFDAVAVRYTSRLSGVDALSMMMLDVLSKLPELKICVAYELDGEVSERFPSHVDDLRRVTPVYETMPGWQTDITQVRQYGDLPKAARNYVERIASLIGCPIEVVSVGPDRRQTIAVGKLLEDRVAQLV